jgi:hypothetical protein
MSAAAAPSTKPSVPDAFQALLAHAETLGLSEGDYLTVANSLQTAFKRADAVKGVKLRRIDVSLTLKRHSQRIRIRSDAVIISPFVPHGVQVQDKYHIITEVLDETDVVVKAYPPVTLELNKVGWHAKRIARMFHPLHGTLAIDCVSVEREMCETLQGAKAERAAEKVVNEWDDDEDDEHIYDEDSFWAILAYGFSALCGDARSMPLSD